MFATRIILPKLHTRDLASERNAAFFLSVAQGRQVGEQMGFHTIVHFHIMSMMCLSPTLSLLVAPSYRASVPAKYVFRQSGLSQMCHHAHCYSAKNKPTAMKTKALSSALAQALVQWILRISAQDPLLRRGPHNTMSGNDIKQDQFSEHLSTEDQLMPIQWCLT